jgi:hypothetical protein
MLARADFGVRRRDLALLIDQVADATGVTGFGVGAGAVLQADLALGVAEQFEGKIELFGERGVILDGVEADPENGNVVLFEIGIEVTEPATLVRSTRCVGFGVEPKQNFAATQG